MTQRVWHLVLLIMAYFILGDRFIVAENVNRGEVPDPWCKEIDFRVLISDERRHDCEIVP